MRPGELDTRVLRAVTVLRVYEQEHDVHIQYSILTLRRHYKTLLTRGE